MMLLGTRNNLRTVLLVFQQGGRHAKSTFTKWPHDPLLDVDTNVDMVVDDLFAFGDCKEGVGSCPWEV